MSHEHGSRAGDPVPRVREALVALHASTFDVHAGVDLPLVLRRICDNLRDFLGCRSVVLSVVEGHELEAVAFSGTHDDAQRLGAPAPVTDWLHMLATGEACGDLTWVQRPSLGPAAAADVPLDLLVAPMVDGNGELVGAFSVDVARDEDGPDQLVCTLLEMYAMQVGVAIHQRRLADRAQGDDGVLRLSEQRFRLAFENAPIGMVELLDLGGTFVVARINRATSRMFGVGAAEARERQVDTVLPVADGPGIAAELTRLRNEQAAQGRVETRFERTDGSQFWGLLEVARLPGDDQPTILCQIVDISQAKAAERELTRHAHHDPLTGLINRRVILDRLDRAVASAAAGGHRGAVLFCDLDRFKAVNDAHGHLVGDEVLTGLATRLASLVRHTDTVGRLGGDEFVVIASPITMERAEDLAQRIEEAFSRGLVLAGLRVRVGVTIGIAPITGADTAADVLRQADAAMYDARRNGDLTLDDSA